MTIRKHEEIADSLTRDILVGQYRTGERLPSERDLAARFDANRGAVREAMKKLEQLGIACIQPGGARVAPLNEASLDVIGHLMAIGEVPDEDLVDQILVVMQHLITLAAESAVRRATDAEIDTIRERVQALARPDGNVLATEARFELMSAIMAASGNLVCQLIARALLAQFAPRIALLEGRIPVDMAAHRRYAERLDAALADRDADAVRVIFRNWSDFNRDAARRAFATLRQSHPRPQQVVSS